MRIIASARNRLAEAITECWGFDCTYNRDDFQAWPRWATQRPASRLYLYYIAGSKTEDQALRIKSQGLPNVQVTPSRTPAHGRVPLTHLPELLVASRLFAAHDVRPPWRHDHRLSLPRRPRRRPDGTLGYARKSRQIPGACRVGGHHTHGVVRRIPLGLPQRKSLAGALRGGRSRAILWLRLRERGSRCRTRARHRAGGRHGRRLLRHQSPPPRCAHQPRGLRGCSRFPAPGPIRRDGRSLGHRFVGARVSGR